jgi:hypothetical protein
MISLALAEPSSISIGKRDILESGPARGRIGILARRIASPCV